MKAIIYKDELGKDVEVTEIPAELADAAQAAREHLLEEVSHYDDELVELILEEAEIPADAPDRRDPQGDARHQAHAGAVRLVLQEQGRAAAARRRDRLPAEPARRPARRGHRAGQAATRTAPADRKADDAEPFAALAFKIMADPYVGKLTYFRVYSGKLEAGSRVLNVNTGKTERIGRILMMHANDREDVQEVYAGDIAAAVGIKQVFTGDTLCRARQADPAGDDDVPRAGHQGRDRAEDEGRPGEDVGRPRPPGRGGPDLPGRTNEETGQTEISGMGELHLEVLVDRMMREFKVDANIGRPQVSYRETVRGTAQKVEGRFVRQTGGSGQYGIVYIDIEPAPGEGFDFVNKIKGGSIPTEFIPAVEKGVEEALETGVLAGYPMVDVRVTLTDGKYHDTDSSEIAFKIAGSLALQEAAAPRQARAARAGVQGRGRSRPRSSSATSSATSPAGAAASRAGAARQRAVVPAYVPLSEMFGYATDLRSMTQGRATYTMQFERYDEVPPNIAEKVIEERTGEPVAAVERARLHGFALRRAADERTENDRDLERSNPKWRRRSSSATSRTSTSAPSVTSTTARRR